jgi:adenosylmethionine-8-amino-7-oxononanoate aminotransferase
VAKNGKQRVTDQTTPSLPERSEKMEAKRKRMDHNSHLFLFRTPKDQLREGITVITKGDGVRVFDQDGNSYIDFVSAITRAIHVGYGQKEIADAVHEQICELPYWISRGFSNIPAMELAEVLADLTPGKITKFGFVCGGSEAVETAIKLAKHYHYYRGDKRRYKVISRRGAYHGVTGGALSVLGTILPMRQIMEPLAPGTVFVESPYCYRCPIHLTYPSCDVACARDVERIIQFEDPEQISAFIGEPIQQGFGALAPPKEYWKIIRDICDRYGILIIDDEVICGFGRTGKWFGIEHFDIEPDIMDMAKGLSSGYLPLGAAGCTDKVMEPIDIFLHFHTYANHPVACAAALKNIEIMQRDNLIEHAYEMGIYLLDNLKNLESHPIAGEIRGMGLWAAIDLTTDKKSKASFPLNRITSMVNRAKKKGLIIKSIGEALEFAPPLIIQKKEIDEAIKIVDECITEEEKDMGL